MEVQVWGGERGARRRWGEASEGRGETEERNKEGRKDGWERWGGRAGGYGRVKEPVSRVLRERERSRGGGGEEQEGRKK